MQTNLISNCLKIVRFCRFITKYDADRLRGFQLRYESSSEPPQKVYRIGECGGTVTSPSGTLTSPSYPDVYPDLSDCKYTIKPPSAASEGSVIRLNFKIFDIEFTNNCAEDGEGDYISVCDGSDCVGDNELLHAYSEGIDRGRLGPTCGEGIHGSVPAFLQGTKDAIFIQ